MNHFGMDWWTNEQNKQKERQEGQEVSRINRMLQQILHRIERHIKRENYRKEAEAVNRHLVQSQVWDIGYINNMENPKVALEQGLFIATIALQEKFDDHLHVINEVDRYMRQLGNVDWGIFGEYNRRFQVIHAKYRNQKSGKADSNQ